MSLQWTIQDTHVDVTNLRHKKEVSNSNIVYFRVQEFEDKEMLKEFLRKLANATYENFRNMTDIPNNPIKNDKYLDAVVEVSIVTYR